MDSIGGYRTRRVVRRRRRLIGGSKFTDFLSKANAFLRKHKIISGVASALGPAVPYASQVGSVASKLGYGRRRRRVQRKKKISIVIHPGGALSLPGGRIRRTRRRY